jgi:hypothetical protein
MIEGSIFIGAVIIAVTQVVKYLNPQVNGALTIGVAVLVGILVALLDKKIGVVDLTVAQGIMVALAAVGVHATARQIG